VHAVTIVITTSRTAMPRATRGFYPMGRGGNRRARGGCCVRRRRTRMRFDHGERGRTASMYIGGGVIVLILIILLVIFLVRR
jgi:hypothetical protein